jgi:heparin binding hemagglutinin HbhA
MPVINELRKSLTEYPPVLAVVGATDLAVEQVRKAAADPAALQAEVGSRLSKAANEVEKAVSGIDSSSVQAFVSKNLDPKVLRETARQAPALVVARALEVAGELETGYEHLAARGKALVHRIEKQKPTQELVTQGRATLSRTRAAVTTGRKAVDKTEREVGTEVRAARKAVTRTTATARRSSASTASAAKGAVTSNRKTAAKTAKAAQAAAKKVGD